MPNELSRPATSAQAHTENLAERAAKWRQLARLTHDRGAAEILEKMACDCEQAAVNTNI